MKVNGRTEAPESLVTREIAKQDAVRITTKSGAAAEKAAQIDTTAEQPESQDTVTVGLSRLLSEELSPEKIAAERRANVERIKAMMAEGKEPSLREVAKAFVEEVDAEIATSPVKFGEDE